MKYFSPRLNQRWLGLILFTTAIAPANAQPVPITPASDGTGTVINQNGNQFNINGGSLSGDSQNLFHSFEQFGLSEGQIANFISNSEIQNILGRVVGGNASIINGLIQVTGSNANLYLINPAGVIFGTNSSLNIPGSLTVTTATGIDFNDQTFQSLGANDYANLIGNPSGYRFDLSQAGVILNEGNLSLEPGQNLTLLGGTVINTGTLSAPGGTLTMAAVPGESLVRISQSGQLLNLEVTPLNNGKETYAINPLTLPELLTGGEVQSHVNTVSINTSGEVFLNHSNTIIPNQEAVAIASGNINAADNNNIGGDIGIFGNIVGLVDGNLDVSGVNGGGNIRIGGDYQGNGLVPNASQTFVSNSDISADAITDGNGGRVIVWSDENTNFQGNITAVGGNNIGDGGFVEISGKENLTFEGKVDVGAINGLAGTILFDPKNIVIEDQGNDPINGNSQFSENPENGATFDADLFTDLTGEVILEANNDIVINEAIITNSLDTLEFRAGHSIKINADIDTSASNGNINLRANNNNAILENRESGLSKITQQPGTTINAGSGNILLEIGELTTGGEINIDNIITSGNLSVNANGGNINRVTPESTIRAENTLFQTFGSGGIGTDISPLQIDANNIEAEAGRGGVYINFLNSINVGGVSDNFNGIVSRNQGNILLNTQGNFNLTERLDTVTIGDSAGDITINSSGQIDTTQGEIKAIGNDGNGGNILIDAEVDILTGFINSSAENPGNIAGNITLNSNTGDINTTADNIHATATGGLGGNVSFTAAERINIGFVSTSGASEAGDITIISNNGDIELSDSELIADAFQPTGIQGTININAEQGSIFKGESEVGFDPDEIADFSGDIILEAYNDITLSEDIITSDSIQIQAGRSIFLNASIDTSSGNGNIVLRANNVQAAENLRETGAASIIQQQGEFLAAGSGNILLEIGNAGEIGNIQIDNINTTGIALLDTNGGNIQPVTQTSQITANSALFRTTNTGGIGLLTAPIAINVNNLEVTTGSGGAFFTSLGESLTIGGITDELDGIETTGGGSVFIDAAGDISLIEEILTGGDTALGGSVELVSDGNINTTEGVIESVPRQPEGQGGDITLNATGDILTGEIYSRGDSQGGNVNLTTGGSLDTTADIIDASGPKGTGGSVNLNATNDIRIGFITTFGETQGGDITLESTAGNIDVSEGFLDAKSLLGSDGIITPELVFNNPPPGEPGVFQPGGEIEFEVSSVADFSGNVIFEAYNDVTIDQPIVSTDSIQIKAGRSIFINANIDTSSGNGNIVLKANNPGAAANLREPGNADIIQQTGTTLNSGSGNILFEIGSAGEVGNIVIGDINTTGLAVFDANGGNIDGTTDNSLVTANSAIFHTHSQGGIGSPTAPIRMNINNLEAVTGATGAFFNSPNSSLTIGDVTNRLEGINSFSGGQISINSTGDIIVTEPIARASFFGQGGNIDLNSQGNIDTSFSQIISFSANGIGGNVSLNAVGDIRTGLISAEGIQQGGSINITSQTGSIDTTANGNLTNSIVDADADVTSAEVAQTFADKPANLNAFAEEGNGGEIIITAPGNIITGDISSFGESNSGNVSILSQTGNVTTGVIFSTTETGLSGNIQVESNSGNIQVNHIATYSAGGEGGDINLNSQDNITVHNIASFGEQGSGDVNLQSTNGTITTGQIQTLSPGGKSGNITLNTYSTSGDIQTANLQTSGETGAGQISITTTDGNVITQDLNSSSNSGEAGGVDVNSGGDITTGDQTVDAAEGDATVNNNADGDVTTGNQTATTETGDSTVNNNAGEDLNTGDQTATTETGDSTVNNNAGEDLNTGNQTATTETGDSTVNNNADDNITTGNQTATTETGDSTVNNNADDNITTGNQTATTETGDSTVNNNADDNITTGDQTATTEIGNATINNNAGEDLNTGNQTATTQIGNATINNQAEGNITTGNQTAITQIGNATINNQADGNITTDNQTAITQIGNATINNQADGNITTDNQTAITQIGNATVNNNAGGDLLTENQTAITDIGNATVNNNADGNITTENQTAITENGEAKIENQTPENLETGNQVALEGEASGTIINEVGGEINTQEYQLNSTPFITLLENRIDLNTATNIANNLPQFVSSMPTSEQIKLAVAAAPRLSEMTGIAPEQIISILASNKLEGDFDLPSRKSGSKFDKSSENNRDIISSLNSSNTSILSVSAVDNVAILEQNRSVEFNSYFGDNFSRNTTTTENVRDALSDVESQTGTRSAIVYVTLLNNQIDLVIFTANGQPLRKTVSNVSRAQILETAKTFRNAIVNPRHRNSQKYLESSQQLYQWLIAPLEEELNAQSIDTLLLSMDSGLRSLPIAALHDGQRHLVEKYSLSLIPSITLTDMRYRTLQDTQVLAMGASQFDNLNPLPAVPVELETITQSLWQGNAFLEQQFTRENLVQQRKDYPYPIIHLATHGEFRAGDPSQSYIQLWGQEQIKLDELRKLGWHEPAVELLVLSACRTALGDEQAELGFAGLAVQAGVKSALASLWYVSDEGTLGLMTEFYTHLSQVKIKSEALRKAQLAMIQGDVIIESGQLRGSTSRGAVVQLPQGLARFETMNLSHPYYWAGFTMIGSPW
jgi:CHAT domain-containing protein